MGKPQLLVVNGYGYTDDLDRLEYCIEIIAMMHGFFGISMEEAAGHFDRYAHNAMGFVTSEMFFHAITDELAWKVYYGKWEWELEGQATPVPKPYP